MSEWIKILISAVIGFGSAILLEPVKRWIQNKIIAKEVERGFYVDVNMTYQSFRAEQEGRTGRISREVFLDLKLEAFEYYYNQNRAAVYKLREWYWMVFFLNLLRDLQRDVRLENKTVDYAMLMFMSNLEDAIKTGDLNCKKLISAEGLDENRFLNRSAGV